MTMYLPSGLHRVRWFWDRWESNGNRNACAVKLSIRRAGGTPQRDRRLGASIDKTEMTGDHEGHGHVVVVGEGTMP